MNTKPKVNQWEWKRKNSPFLAIWISERTGYIISAKHETTQFVCKDFSGKMIGCFRAVTEAIQAADVHSERGAV